MFHGTKIPVRTWVLVIFEMAASKNGMSRPRDRAQVRPDRQDRLVHGAPHPRGDEARPHGRPALRARRRGRDVVRRCAANRHGHDPSAAVHGPYQSDKSPIMSLDLARDRRSSLARRQRVKPDNLRAVLTEQVDPKATHLHTDTSAPYSSLGPRVREPQCRQPQERRVRARRRVHQPSRELLRAAQAVAGRDAPPRQPRAPAPLLTEFDFRYSTCKLADSERMARIVGGTTPATELPRPTRG